MTASEFAFLALGLVLGIASGSALVVVLGSRPPAREVKVTVGHDAVPRRAATLSSDAFTAHGEPARGGPADRRRLDRDAPGGDPPPGPQGLPGLTGVPVMAAAAAVRMPVAAPAGRAPDSNDCSICRGPWRPGFGDRRRRTRRMPRLAPSGAISDRPGARPLARRAADPGGALGRARPASRAPPGPPQSSTPRPTPEPEATADRRSARPPTDGALVAGCDAGPHPDPARRPGHAPPDRGGPRRRRCRDAAAVAGGDHRARGRGEPSGDPRRPPRLPGRQPVLGYVHDRAVPDDRGGACDGRVLLRRDRRLGGRLRAGLPRPHHGGGGGRSSTRGGSGRGRRRTRSARSTAR